MSSRRMARVNELIKREIAAGLYRVVNEAGFDFAAVTITRVEVSPDLHKAHVYVSIAGHAEDRGRMMRLIRKHASDLQRRIGKAVRMKYVPRLAFSLDSSISEGDRVLEIIRKLEHEASEDSGGEDQNGFA